jgi:hypothetical protein
MDRRTVWICIALAVFVLGAAAVNLAMRPDDSEPESMTPAPLVRAPAPDRAEPEEAPAPPQAPAAVVEPEAPPAAHCDHPFIPTEVGTWRRYTWRLEGSDFDGTGQLVLEAQASREIGNGRLEVPWRVGVVAGDGEPRTATLTMWCEPGGESEEPWFGTTDIVSGRRMIRGARRWHWPVELSVGTHIDGELTFRPSPSESEQLGPEYARELERASRRHEVVARERITVPAGELDVWRVDYTEERALGQHVRRGRGTLWIAEEIGLVKSRAETALGAIETMELAEYGLR